MKKILISKREPTVLDSSIFISDDSSYFLWCFVHHRVLTLFDPFIPIILFVFNSALEVTLTVLLYCPFQRGITLFKLFSTNSSHCQKDDSQTPSGPHCCQTCQWMDCVDLVSESNAFNLPVIHIIGNERTSLFQTSVLRE